jgi:hypothetical protein
MTGFDLEAWRQDMEARMRADDRRDRRTNAILMIAAAVLFVAAFTAGHFTHWTGCP